MTPRLNQHIVLCLNCTNPAIAKPKTVMVLASIIHLVKQIIIVEITEVVVLIMSNKGRINLYT